MASHPAVGGWDMTGEVDGDTFSFLAIFHADGTYMKIYPWGAILISVWQPTGERTADGTAVNYFLVDDKLVRGEGRFTAEVDEAGNAIATDGTFVSRFEDGSIEFATGDRHPVRGPAGGAPGNACWDAGHPRRPNLRGDTSGIDRSDTREGRDVIPALALPRRSPRRTRAISSSETRRMTLRPIAARYLRQPRLPLYSPLPLGARAQPPLRMPRRAPVRTR
jgi:hypothetical protein